MVVFARAVTGFYRTASLLGAMIAGVLVPQAHTLAWAIRYLVMAMLFLVFLQTRITRDSLRRSHAILLVANLTIGFAAWWIGGKIGGSDVAMAAFYTGITPTAAAAPVIISFLKGRVDFVVASFVLTNLVIAALFPVLLPLVMGTSSPALAGHVLANISVVVFVPLGCAILTRRLHPAAREWPGRLRTFSFGMWCVALFLVTANASAFLRTQISAPALIVTEIAVTSFVLCALNFGLGAVIGGREFRREASQSLGQKNTTFTIFLALTYGSPLIALGPTCYVLWHNLWNSWQLNRMSSAQRRIDSVRTDSEK